MPAGRSWPSPDLRKAAIGASHAPVAALLYLRKESAFFAATKRF